MVRVDVAAVAFFARNEHLVNAVVAVGYAEVLVSLVVRVCRDGVDS